MAHRQNRCATQSRWHLHSLTVVDAIRTSDDRSRILIHTDDPLLPRSSPSSRAHATLLSLSLSLRRYTIEKTFKDNQSSLISFFLSLSLRLISLPALPLSLVSYDL